MSRMWNFSFCLVWKSVQCSFEMNLLFGTLAHGKAKREEKKTIFASFWSFVISFICTSNHSPFTSNIRCFALAKKKHLIFLAFVDLLHNVVIASILQSDNRISMFGRWIYVFRNRRKGEDKKKQHSSRKSTPKDIIQTFSLTKNALTPRKMFKIFVFRVVSLPSLYFIRLSLVGEHSNQHIVNTWTFTSFWNISEYAVDE